jgi:Ni/Fe-hydrogenase subunit HybB-like protein
VTERNRWLKDLLWFLALAGAVSVLFRLVYGLGATTNLSDATPWGLWKILNMVAGVALSTGGFTVGFLVYGLRLEGFRPLVRPAILIAFLGYGSSVFALLLDIGLPHRIWHPLLMWNERSFLFEVAWCVFLYFTVTILELSPTFLDRLGLRRPTAILRRISLAVVVVGIALSSLHHSSLGSLFLVTPWRLHPLWYTPRLPWMFILSAMGAGMMVVVLARFLHSRWYGSQDAGDTGCIRGLAVIAGGVLGTYLVLKVVDLAITDGWRYMLAGTWESWLYGLELAMTSVIPVSMLMIPAVRRSAGKLAAAATCAVAGVVLNRLDVGIFGYFRDSGAYYVPSLNEWALSLGVLAAAGLFYLYVVENYPIFDDAWRVRSAARGGFQGTFDRASMVWHTVLGGSLQRTTAIAVIAVPLAWALLYPPFHDTGSYESCVIHPPLAADDTRSVLTLDGDRDGLAVVFPHEQHRDRLGGAWSCSACHHLSRPSDRATPCSQCHTDMERTTSIFAHDAHYGAVARAHGLAGPVPANRSCSVCHGESGAKTAAGSRTCLECHGRDMRPADGGRDSLRTGVACGYRKAMHDTCIACHVESRERVQRPGLAECGLCHRELRFRKPAPGGVTAMQTLSSHRSSDPT